MQNRYASETKVGTRWARLNFASKISRTGSPRGRAWFTGARSWKAELSLAAR